MLCFDYQEKLLLAFALLDFSNDVCVSTAEVEDSNEVIENVSNLACDKSSGDDLMRLNPNIQTCARSLQHIIGWALCELGDHILMLAPVTLMYIDVFYVIFFWFLVCLIRFTLKNIKRTQQVARNWVVEIQHKAPTCAWIGLGLGSVPALCILPVSLHNHLTTQGSNILN